MKNAFYGLSVAILFSINISAYAALTPTVLGQLPSQIDESSGLSIGPAQENWSHNDGYGDNRLYCFNSSGTLTRTLTLSNATNVDWEDITHDSNFDHLFVGDFGNNANDRTNLRIYRIPHPSSFSGSSVSADIIRFSYPDQQSFPSPWMNFDTESMIHHNGHLYLFTKPDGSAVGYTKLYRLPDQPGTYVATLIDSFYTNDRPTSAAINEDGSALIVMAVSRMHIFQNWTGDNFFSGQHTQINFGGVYTQKEAITFRSRSEVYLTDENNGSGNFLYKADLSVWIPPVATAIGPVHSLSEDVTVYPNPANNMVHVKSQLTGNDECRFELYDLTGNRVKSTVVPASIGVKLDVSMLPAGVYYYKFYDDNGLAVSRRLVVQH